MSASLLQLLDIIGVVVFALSGATLGIRKRLDLYGILVLGFCTALGGGILRDIVLGQVPYTLTTTLYPGLAIASSAALYLLRPERLLGVARLMSLFDAVGLGVVAAAATAKALDAGVFPWFTCVLLGGVAGSGGGMVRDVLAGDIPLVLRPGEIYAVAALAGGGVVAALAPFGWANADLAVWLGAATTLVIRLVAIRYKWQLPGPPPTE